MLQLKSVCAGYGKLEKIHDLSAEFAPGQLIALVGPNGSGKSTLLKAIAGLIRPLSGDICLDAQSLVGRSPRDTARSIAFMPQLRETPALTVRQLAAHGRYPHLGIGRKLTASDLAAVDTAIACAGVALHADTLLANLSGGERQRAYIALLLAQDTPIMLLDEPTTYLDMRSQFEMMELLSRLRDEQPTSRTLIIVLHDLALALRYCDSLLLLQSGQIVASGTPRTVYESGELARTFGVNITRHAGNEYSFSMR